MYVEDILKKTLLVISTKRLKFRYKGFSENVLVKERLVDGSIYLHIRIRVRRYLIPNRWITFS
jgi:hypothetical protein